ncbi:MAG: urea amidolyase associated protein UAAP1, partial [Pseudomonadales bacterium]
MKLSSYNTVIDGGSHWSLIVRKDVQLTITDITGGANVGLVFYNPYMPSEKFNAPDTLKCQHTFKLTRGNCLYSDMGRIFCSITEDSFGWHEAVCGNSNARQIEEKWGARDYQSAGNHWHQNGYDSFLTELAKYNLGKKDLVANVNFFSKVTSSKSGELTLSGRSRKGDHVVLRFEMDTLLLLHTCPHPLNHDATYPDTPVDLLLETAPPPADDDYCLN